MGEDTDAILRSLEALGIKGYEGKAYLALLRIGEETAPNLASKAGVPLPRIYDVLRSLCRKGLVETRAGRPRKYRALPPSIGLARYVRSYIDQLISLNNRVVEELEKLYKSTETREPYLWVSHSIDAGIERTIEWVKQMAIDGYASLSQDMFLQILPALLKRLSRRRTAPFSVTLTDYPGDKVLRRVEGQGNLRLLHQSTGFIRALETDFERAVIFGEGYALLTTEPELLVLLNDTYYFGYWRNVEVVKEFEVGRGDRYYTRHQWLVMPIIDAALRDNHIVVLKVTGKWVRTGKPAELQAYAKRVYRSPDDRTRTIVVETEEGEELSIGGLGASVEDIEAHYIALEIT